jgi:pimeloyl-ACP methyl ester carboxylesterase
MIVAPGTAGKDRKTRMSDCYADIEATSIHYEGRGQGYPVAAIHAGIVNMAMWDEQMDALSEYYQMIRYDIRGWGKSAENDQDYSDHGDLYALLSFLEVEKAVLIGASFGGGVAIDLALAYPEVVEALVLVGPDLGGYKFTKEGHEREHEALQAAYEAGDKALAAEYAAQIWIDGRGRTSADVAETVRAKALEMIRDTFELPDSEGNRIELEPPAIERLDEIDIPVLVILGEYDQPDIYTISRLVHRSVPNARLEIIKDSAHLPNMEKPAEFNEIVLDFLKHHLSE